MFRGNKAKAGAEKESCEWSPELEALSIKYRAARLVHLGRTAERRKIYQRNSRLSEKAKQRLRVRWER